MGICQTAHMDNVILMFERVEIGSLFHLLHEKNMVNIRYFILFLNHANQLLSFFFLIVK